MAAAADVSMPSVSPEPGGRYLNIHIEGRTAKALVDTGADETIVRYDKLPEGKIIFPVQHSVKLADGSNADLMGQTVVDLQIGNCVESVNVLVSKNLCEDCLVGAQLLVTLGAVVDLGTGVMVVRSESVPLHRGGGAHRVARVIVPKSLLVEAGTEVIMSGEVQDRCVQGQTCVLEPEPKAENKLGLCVAHLAVTVANKCVPIRVSNLTESDIKVYQGTHIANVQVVDDDAFLQVPPHTLTETTDFNDDVERAVGHLDPQDQVDFGNILHDYRDVFTGLGRTNIAEHCIPTGDHSPIFQNYRPVPGHLRGQVADQLQKLVDEDVLRPVADSQWASPLVCVRKAQGSKIRICGDFRRINKITTPSVQVIPHIESCLQKLAGAKLFTQLDLAQAFHQMPVRKSDRPKCVITTEFGLFEYQTAPFGLQGLPHSFNRAVGMALSGLPPEIYVQYFDDILVISDSTSGMKANLRSVLDCLRRAGFTLSLRKIRLCQPEVTWLGFRVSERGIECSPEKTRLIREWPQPKSVKELRSFLGLCSYVRKFISRYADISKPLTRLTEKGVSFVWSADVENAFQTLKTALASPPVLGHPSFEQAAPPFVLDTDASGVALGACLTQGDKVIAYASRALTKAERQYSVTKRELLAAVWGVQHFRQFCVGRRFVLRIDHSSLQWLFNFKNPEGQIARWLLILSELDFETVHRKGMLHKDGDALSRYPHPENSTAAVDGTETHYRWIRVPVDERKIAHSSDHSVGADAGVQGKPEMHVASAQSREPAGQNLLLGQAAVPNDDSAPEHVREHATPIVGAMTSSSEPGLFTTVQGMTVEQLSREQDRDEGLFEIKSWKCRLSRPQEKHLKSAGAKRLLREWRRLVVRGENNPVLYRRMQTARGAPACLQMVVPNHLRREILTALHSGYGGGHQGADKLEKQVRQRFYWPGIQSDVRKFCRECEACERKRDAPRGSEAPLGSLQSSCFMDRLDIDLIGPLPVSEPDGHKYVLTCIDSFTRFSWAIPLPNQEAWTIAHALMNHVISVFGMPRSIHSDLGRNLTGKVLRGLYEFLGIRQSTTTGYHPIGNAYSERSHRFLMTAVSKMCADHPKTWPNCLGAAVLAMNANTHDSTGISPYEAVFGRPAKLPLDRTFGEEAQVLFEQSVGRNRDILSYVTQLQETVENTEQSIKDASVTSHQQSKILHDSKLVETVFEVGDRVWLRRQAYKKGESPKLAWRWEGPFRILEKRRGWTYKIGTDGIGGGGSKIVHHNRLKLCVSTPTVPQRHSGPERSKETTLPVRIPDLNPPIPGHPGAPLIVPQRPSDPERASEMSSPRESPDLTPPRDTGSILTQPDFTPPRNANLHLTPRAGQRVPPIRLTGRLADNDVRSDCPTPNGLIGGGPRDSFRESVTPDRVGQFGTVRDSGSVQRRSGRVRRPPDRFGDYVSH